MTITKKEYELYFKPLADKMDLIQQIVNTPHICEYKNIIPVMQDKIENDFPQMKADISETKRISQENHTLLHNGFKSKIDQMAEKLTELEKDNDKDDEKEKKYNEKRYMALFTPKHVDLFWKNINRLFYTLFIGFLIWLGVVDKATIANLLKEVLSHYLQ